MQMQLVHKKDHQISHVGGVSQYKAEHDGKGYETDKQEKKPKGYKKK